MILNKLKINIYYLLKCEYFITCHKEYTLAYGLDFVTQT